MFDVNTSPHEHATEYPSHGFHSHMENVDFASLMSTYVDSDADADEKSFSCALHQVPSVKILERRMRKILSWDQLLSYIPLSDHVRFSDMNYYIMAAASRTAN